MVISFFFFFTSSFIADDGLRRCWGWKRKWRSVDEWGVDEYYCYSRSCEEWRVFFFLLLITTLRSDYERWVSKCLAKPSWIRECHSVWVIAS